MFSNIQSIKQPKGNKPQKIIQSKDEESWHLYSTKPVDWVGSKYQFLEDNKDNWGQPESVTKKPLTPEIDVHDFKCKIETYTDFSSILRFAEPKFPASTKPVFSRLSELKNFVDEEIEEGENVSLSLPSLRNLLVFLCAMGKFKNPTITAGDDGLFQVNWRFDRNNVLTVRFDTEFHVTYVIFCPSRYESSRIILNGNMHVLDFTDYILRLKLKTYQMTI